MINLKGARGSSMIRFDKKDSLFSHVQDSVPLRLPTHESESMVADFILGFTNLESFSAENQTSRALSLLSRHRAKGQSIEIFLRM
jgi:hypothetical protein